MSSDSVQVPVPVYKMSSDSVQASISELLEEMSVEEQRKILRECLRAKELKRVDTKGSTRAVNFRT